MPQRLSTWLRTPLAERNKALVGTTALLILALIIFIALQISSGGIGKRTIHAEFAQAAGISSGGPKVSGTQRRNQAETAASSAPNRDFSALSIGTSFSISPPSLACKTR